LNRRGAENAEKYGELEGDGEGFEAAEGEAGTPAERFDRHIEAEIRQAGKQGVEGDMTLKAGERCPHAVMNALPE